MFLRVPWLCTEEQAWDRVEILQNGDSLVDGVVVVCHNDQPFQRPALTVMLLETWTLLASVAVASAVPDASYDYVSFVTRDVSDTGTITLLSEKTHQSHRNRSSLEVAPPASPLRRG